ncbi:polyprenol monophosphomannose synthase [Raineyella fluvialis]|uniref:Glycosyltransferase n=1 Tax=Raineyella fluvialis TaxID=2662261 RepID=A0A5Q2FJW5_9ACTN|nr:polyprenol monophosphomannose synthase [Raineyella fluvialis]QGF24626.1 glycosyltransferase [Raineyella fluvialis]
MTEPTTQTGTAQQTREGSERRILVCIPTYNEAQNIESIVGRLRAAVPAADVVVVDDNSPDGTGDIADRLAAGDTRVHVLHRKGKEGLAAAYVAAFRWGLEQGFDVLVEMDADGSHRPEELPRLLEALERADMVKGSRWVPGGTVVNWPKSREYLSRAGNLYTRIALGVRVKDITGGFNVFRAQTLRDIGLDNIAAAGYFFQTDMTINTIEAGHSVVEVPITFEERQYGESKLDKSIFVESLARTTAWGLKRRRAQLARLTGRGRKPGVTPAS